MTMLVLESHGPATGECHSRAPLWPLALNLELDDEWCVVGMRLSPIKLIVRRTLT